MRLPNLLLENYYFRFRVNSRFRVLTPPKRTKILTSSVFARSKLYECFFIQIGQDHSESGVNTDFRLFYEGFFSQAPMVS